MKYTRLLILLILLSSSGSMKNQEVPRMKLSLRLSDLHEDATVSWFCNSTNIGTCYSGGEIKVRKDVKGCQDVEISGPKMLIIPESISGNYSATATGNQTKRVLDCNITFPESPGPTELKVSHPRRRVVLGVLGGVGLLLLLLVGVSSYILKKKLNNRRERSRSETSPDDPPQTSQPILEGNGVSSRDEDIELHEMSGSDSGISLFTGKSLQVDDEEDP